MSIDLDLFFFQWQKEQIIFVIADISVCYAILCSLEFSLVTC